MHPPQGGTAAKDDPYTSFYSCVSATPTHTDKDILNQGFKTAQTPYQTPTRIDTHQFVQPTQTFNTTLPNQTLQNQTQVSALTGQNMTNVIHPRVFRFSNFCLEFCSIGFFGSQVIHKGRQS